jgi:outer membrane receptor for ferrienterochelin and colicin
MRPGIVAVLCAASSAVAAQTRDPIKDSSRVRLEPVTVTGARATVVVGGASAVVVRPEELRSSPSPLLEQALRESPFVHVRQN